MKAKMNRYVAFVAVCAMSFAVGAVLADCTAPASWFPHKTHKEPDHTIQPANNCEFHRWAWNEFLFLTTPVDGRLLFETLPTDEDLLSPGGTPVAFEKVRPPKMLRLTPRVNKEDGPKKLGDILQAESQGMALIDHQGQDGKQGRAVYYLINVNRKYYDFVRTNKLYDPQELQNASPTLNFDVGSVVVKSAWEILPRRDKAGGFYTTKAMVFPLVTKDGDVIVDPSNPREETVALVGLHVVGCVAGHPEFIWATFEHRKNAPDLPPGMNPDSGNSVSNTEHTFYRAKVAAKNCNQSNAGRLKLVDAAKQELTPVVDVFRQFPQGGGDEDNRINIKTLNDSVHAKLDANSVWQNYDLIGSVWTTGNLLPDQRIRISDSIGSIRLANTTMETTSQSVSNCFTCHNTLHRNVQGHNLPGLNVNISHILRDNFFRTLEARARKEKQGGKKDR